MSAVRRGCPVRAFCGQKGFFRCGRPHFLVQKTSDFSKIMACPHGHGEGGSIFRDFVRTSFMNSLVTKFCGVEYWLVPYSFIRPMRVVYGRISFLLLTERQQVSFGVPPFLMTALALKYISWNIAIIILKNQNSTISHLINFICIISYDGAH